LSDAENCGKNAKYDHLLPSLAISCHLLPNGDGEFIAAILFFQEISLAVFIFCVMIKAVQEFSNFLV